MSNLGHPGRSGEVDRVVTEPAPDAAPAGVPADIIVLALVSHGGVRSVGRFPKLSATVERVETYTWHAGQL